MRETQTTLLVFLVLLLVGLLVARHLFRVRTGEAKAMDPWAQLERAMRVWGTLPTAQASFTLGAICILQTSTRYTLSSDHVLRGGQVISTWQPSAEWLTFLASILAIATGHAVAKRVTDRDYASTMAAAKAGKVTAPPGEVK